MKRIFTKEKKYFHDISELEKEKKLCARITSKWTLLFLDTAWTTAEKKSLKSKTKEKQFLCEQIK